MPATLPLWKQWCNINNQVERFFNRCVGSRIALYYPVGRSVIGATANGEPIEKTLHLGIDIAPCVSKEGALILVPTCRTSFDRPHQPT